ncbi:MAG: AI-2E family transporter [Sarcina sp.]
MSTKKNPLFEYGLFICAFTALFILFIFTLKYTLPFILAFLFANILKTPTKYLVKKFKIKVWLASLFVTISFFLIISLVLALVLFALALEIIDLSLDIKTLISNHSLEISTYIENLEIFFQSLNLDVSYASITNYLSGSLTKVLDILTYVFQIVIYILKYIPLILSIAFFTIISTYFLTIELISNFKFLYKLNSKSILLEIKNTFSNFLLSYTFIIFISTGINFLIFYFLNIKYALTFSILAGLFDLLPLIGISIIYIPLILYFLLQKQIIVAILLSILLIIIFIARQLIENKLLSSKLSIKPIQSIFALFIGVQTGNFKLTIFFILFFVFSKIYLEQKNISPFSNLKKKILN